MTTQLSPKKSKLYGECTARILPADLRDYECGFAYEEGERESPRFYFVNHEGVWEQIVSDRLCKLATQHYKDRDTVSLVLKLAGLWFERNGVKGLPRTLHIELDTPQEREVTTLDYNPRSGSYTQRRQTVQNPITTFLDSQ